jgi:hypothetical protein
MGKLDERIARAQPSLLRRLATRQHSGYGLITPIAVNHLEVIMRFDSEDFHFRRRFGHTVVTANFWKLPNLDKDLLAPLAKSLMIAVRAGYNNFKPHYTLSYEAYAEAFAFNQILTVSSNRVRMLIDQEIVVFLRSLGHYDPSGSQCNLLRSHLQATYVELALSWMDAADYGKELVTPKPKSQNKSLDKLYSEKQTAFPFF